MFQGLTDGAQQYILAEWFREEFDGARLHSLHGLGHIAVAGYKNNRHVIPVHTDVLLQLEAIKPRERNVKNETAGDRDSRMIEKFLCRREGQRTPTFGANQEFQRFANRNIVVNNEHD